MNEVRIPINIEIMPAKAPMNSLADASSHVEKPDRVLTMSFKPTEEFRQVWTRIENHWKRSYAAQERDFSFFTQMQSRSGGDLPMDELVGWHFNERMNDDQRVLRMIRNRIDRECSLPPDSILQPQGHKRQRLEDLGQEQQEAFKKRRLEESRRDAEVAIRNADTPMTSSENTSAAAHAPDKQEGEGVRRLDRQGFAVPALPDRLRNAHQPGNSQAIVLVEDSQPQAQNGTSPDAPLIVDDDVVPEPRPSRNAFQMMASSQGRPSTQANSKTTTIVRWTKEEDDAILDGKAKKWKMARIIEEYNLKRTESALRNRLKELATKAQDQLSSQLQIETTVPSSSQPRNNALHSTSLPSSNTQVTNSQLQLETPQTSPQIQSGPQQPIPQVQSNSNKNVKEPEVVFDWPSPPFERRNKNINGKINAGCRDFPHWIDPDHCWVESDDVLWARALKKAKPEWIKYMFNHFKAANVQMIYMASENSEACKKLARTRRLARAEVRRKMGLKRLQDTRRPRCFVRGMPESDREWSDVPDSQFDPEDEEDDQLDIIKMYKESGDYTDDELLEMVNRAEDGEDGQELDDDAFPWGVIRDRHVSEVSDNDEEEEDEEEDDYDKNRTILVVPGFAPRRASEARDHRSGSRIAPPAQPANNLPRRVTRASRDVVQGLEIDVYDAARDFVETRESRPRSTSPTVETTRTVGVNVANELAAEDPIEDNTGPSDFEILQSLVDSDADPIVDPMEEDEATLPTDAEVLQDLADSGEFDDYDEDIEEGIEYFDAKAEPSSDEPPAIPNLDGTNDPAPIAKPAPKKKTKKTQQKEEKPKSKPGFGYYERTEEEARVARAAQASPGTIARLSAIPVPIDVPRDCNVVPYKATDTRYNDSFDFEEDGNAEGRQASRRRRRKMKRKAAEGVKVVDAGKVIQLSDPAEEVELDNPSKRTTVSVTGSPQAKGSTNEPTPIKVAAEHNQIIVQSAKAYHYTKIDSPPAQPKFRPRPKPRSSRPAAPVARPPSETIAIRDDIDPVTGGRPIPGYAERMRILSEMPAPKGPRPKSPPPKLPYPSDDESWDSSSDEG